MTEKNDEIESQQAASTQLLCIVSPCYNEQEVLPMFYNELKSVLDSIPNLDFQIILVDDGSTDATLDVINTLASHDPRVLGFSFSRNFGHQIAISAGMDMACGDGVLCMDSDLQHPPALIPKMVELWREGNDIVSGVRQTTAQVSFLKRLTSSGFYWLINRLSDTHIVPGAADFYLLSRPAHEALKRMPERHRFLRGMISWIGFRRALVPFSAPARAAGTSKYTPLKMVRLALDAVFSFSAVPIRLIGRFGMSIVLLGSLYLLYILTQFFFWKNVVPGWTSVIAVVLVLGGLQMLAIGVSGEYLARIFETAKQRPLYFFKQTPKQQPRGLTAEPILKRNIWRRNGVDKTAA